MNSSNVMTIGASRIRKITDNPKVSVTVVTYNHGEWLAECLESIVNQKTNFSFEVIVGDDASTDGITRDVLGKFHEAYPDLIVPIFREYNVGPTSNYFDVVSRARGQYIAHMDGDDLMLPGKLQEQADLLDANPDFSMVVHDMLPLPKADNNLSGSGGRVSIGTVTDLLLNGCYFCHSSKMYRSAAIVSRSSERPVVDYFLHIEHAISGKIGYVSTPLGGHRLHPKGISRDPAFKSLIASAYNAAYDRALELGLPADLVTRGRLRYRMAQAINSLIEKDYVRFSEISRIAPGEWKLAPLKLRVLSICRCVPALLRKYFVIKDFLR